MSKFVETIVRTKLDERSRGRADAIEDRGSWRIVRRGDTSGRVAHDYECPDHGRFTALVSRADVPDTVPCERCEMPASWRGSMCGIGKPSGEVTS
jgi:hypothetical protein